MSFLLCDRCGQLNIDCECVPDPEANVGFPEADPEAWEDARRMFPNATAAIEAAIAEALAEFAEGLADE